MTRRQAFESRPFQPFGQHPRAPRADSRSLPTSGVKISLWVIVLVSFIGGLFSAEKGGGLFAMNYSLRGPAANPSVVVNPLSALTPGFLRGLFGVFDKPDLDLRSSAGKVQ